MTKVCTMGSCDTCLVWLLVRKEELAVSYWMGHILSVGAVYDDTACTHSLSHMFTHVHTWEAHIHSFSRN